MSTDFQEHPLVANTDAIALCLALSKSPIKADGWSILQSAARYLAGIQTSTCYTVERLDWTESA